MCPVFRFPHPTGHHGIGTVTYHWVDADRPEAFTADSDDRRQQNTFQVEELVSHGYVVAAIDQPYVAATVVFQDGRQAAYDPRWDPPHSAFMDAHIPYLAQDAVFTLEQLAALNRADPTAS